MQPDGIDAAHWTHPQHPAKETILPCSDHHFHERRLTWRGSLAQWRPRGEEAENNSHRPPNNQAVNMKDNWENHLHFSLGRVQLQFQTVKVQKVETRNA